MKLYDEMTWQERRIVRKYLEEKQKGLCYYCKEPLSIQPKNKQKINWSLFPKNFTKYPVHLHHSHESGECLGAVHSYCNAVLWQYHGE